MKNAPKKTAKPRPPRPGQGNPHWGRAHVMQTQQHDWKAEKWEKRRSAPITLEAGPGPEDKRVKVALGESVMDEHIMWSRGPSRQMLDLSIDFRVPMRPGGIVRINREPISLAQALSFEEAVRAVFRAAREKGILPPVSHNDL